MLLEHFYLISPFFRISVLPGPPPPLESSHISKMCNWLYAGVTYAPYYSRHEGVIEARQSTGMYKC